MSLECTLWSRVSIHSTTYRVDQKPLSQIHQLISSQYQSTMQPRKLDTPSPSISHIYHLYPDSLSRTSASQSLVSFSISDRSPISGIIDGLLLEGPLSVAKEYLKEKTQSTARSTAMRVLAAMSDNWKARVSMSVFSFANLTSVSRIRVNVDMSTFLSTNLTSVSPIRVNNEMSMFLFTSLTSVSLNWVIERTSIFLFMSSASMLLNRMNERASMFSCMSWRACRQTEWLVRCPCYRCGNENLLQLANVSGWNSNLRHWPSRLFYLLTIKQW